VKISGFRRGAEELHFLITNMHLEGKYPTPILELNNMAE
jgi:hypothetical protein